MLQLLLWASLLLSGVCCCSLTVTHTKVIPGITEKVSMTCSAAGSSSSHESDSQPTLSQLSRIRFLKVNDEASWQSLVEIALPNTSYVEFTHTRLPKLEASGYLGHQNASFITLTWPTASADTIGVYKCEVDGFSNDDRKDYHVNSVQVNITESVPTTADLVDIIIQMRARELATNQKLEDFKKQHLNESALLRHKLAELEAKSAGVSLAEVQSLADAHQVARQYWPSGNYSLLATADGCTQKTPYNDMEDGYIKLIYHTSDDQFHEVSNPEHWREPFYNYKNSRHVLTLSFCTKTTPNVVDIKWPKGSYCIHPDKGLKCPDKFQNGEINFHLDASSITIENSNNPSYWVGDSPNYYEYQVCCRNDGDADEPIILPSTKSFYLYRHKGKCQAVSGMDVTNEWLEIDVNSNRNVWYDYEVKDQVDGTLNPDVRLELCYYTKSSRKSKSGEKKKDISTTTSSWFFGRH